MAEKRIFTKDELLAIGDTVRSWKPTPKEMEVYDIIEDCDLRFAGSAPSASMPVRGKNVAPASRDVSGDLSSSAAASLNARFSAERKWEKDDTSANTRGGRGGRAAPDPGKDARTWRGGRDKETFEEGYLYELKANAKHKQVLQSAVAEHEKTHLQQEMIKFDALKRKIEEEKAKNEATPPPTPESELEAMFSKLRSKADESTSELQPGATSAIEANGTGESKKRASRFFSSSAASDDNATKVDLSSASASKTAIALETRADFDGLLAPSSNVVWNQQPANVQSAAPSGQPARGATAPGNNQSARASNNNNNNNNNTNNNNNNNNNSNNKSSNAPSGKSTTSAGPAVPQISKVTVGVNPQQQKGKSNQRVWSAADLESELLGKKEGTAATKPQLISQPTTTPGVFDASLLESQLLGKPAAAAPATTASKQAATTAGPQQTQAVPTTRPAAPPTATPPLAPATPQQLQPQQQQQFAAAVPATVAQAPTGLRLPPSSPQYAPTAPAGAVQPAMALSPEGTQRLVQYLQAMGQQIPSTGGVVQLTPQQFAQFNATMALQQQQQQLQQRMQQQQQQGGMMGQSVPYPSAAVQQQQHQQQQQQRQLSGGQQSMPSGAGNWVVQQPAGQQYPQAANMHMPSFPQQQQQQMQHPYGRFPVGQVNLPGQMQGNPMMMFPQAQHQMFAAQPQHQQLGPR